MTPDPRRIIAFAADILEQQGWCQGAMRDEQADGTTLYCALGALRAARDEIAPGTFLASCLYLVRTKGMKGSPECGLTWWNDAPGRTQAEVVAVLRAAAEGGDS